MSDGRATSNRVPDLAPGTYVIDKTLRQEDLDELEEWQQIAGAENGDTITTRRGVTITLWTKP